MSFEKKCARKEEQRVKDEMWGLHTLQGEVTEEKEEQSETANVRGDLVSRQVGRDLVTTPPQNEGGVRKRCWDGGQMVTVARC